MASETANTAVVVRAIHAPRSCSQAEWTCRRSERSGTAVVRRLFVLTVWSLIGLPHPSADAQSTMIDREAEIKTAYLYNFGKYVTWPAATDLSVGSSSEFVIGIVGNNPLGGALHELAAKKQIDGRKIVIRTFQTKEDYRPCHLVYFPASAADSLVASVLESARTTPALTIGERPGFVQSGGIINLYLEQNRVKFEINLEAARRSEITISSKLLSIGKVVNHEDL